MNPKNASYPDIYDEKPHQHNFRYAPAGSRLPIAVQMHRGYD